MSLHAKVMSTRRFLESDRKALRAVYLETRSQVFTWINAASLRADDFDRDTEGETIWVGACDGRPVAFASIWEPENFIHNLFVHPRAAGQGLGSALLRECLDHLGRPAALKCVAENFAAAGFYQAQGWKCVEEGIGPHGVYLLMHFDDRN